MNNSNNYNSFHFLIGEEATLYGVYESVLLQHLRGWVKHNKIHDKNIREGKAWTYSSLEQMSKSLPFFSVSQIRTIIEKLKKAGILLVGSFNKTAYDRTHWYTINEEASFVEEDNSEPMLKSTNELNQAFAKTSTGLSENKTDLEKNNADLVLNLANGCVVGNRPIPIIKKNNLNNNTLRGYTKPKNVPPQSSVAPKVATFDFEKLFEEYPRREGKALALARCKAKIKTKEDYDNLVRALTNYKNLKKGTDIKYIKVFANFIDEYQDYIGKVQPVSEDERLKTYYKEKAEAKKEIEENYGACTAERISDFFKSLKLGLNSCTA
jgi:hypothetical protein